MSLRASVVVLLAGSGFLLPGCARERLVDREKRVETVGLSGELTIDGKPVPSVRIECVPTTPIQLGGRENLMRGTSDENGRFQVGAYGAGTGVPPGEYALTFVWMDYDPINRQLVGDDKLKNRYDTPEKSPKRIVVEKGKPLELGKIELTTE